MSTGSDHRPDEYVSSYNTGFPPSQRQQQGGTNVAPVQPRSAGSIIFIVIASTVGVCVVLGFFLMFLMFMMMVSIASIGVSMDADNVPEKLVMGDNLSTKKVAIITVSGMIVGGDESFVKKQIDAAKKDEDVVAVVLRVNSPGGTVTGSEYYLHHLKKLKSERNIPIVVSMGDMATSGGYYVSMASDEIFAEQSTITGSIGVVLSRYDMTELFDKIGVEPDPITSGPMKAMGAMGKPLSEEERKIFQDLIDDMFTQFKQVVKDGRDNFNKDPESLDELATGQVYTANQAIANGLIDKIGFQEDAVDRALELAGRTLNNTKVVKYKPNLSVMDKMLGGEIKAPESPSETIVEIINPKAYYLCPGFLPVGSKE